MQSHTFKIIITSCCLLFCVSIVIMNEMQLISDMSMMQKRVKGELQESTRDFQKQLAELNVRLKELKLKEEFVQQQHKAQDDEDNNLNEAVELAKKR